jgi:ATP-binding cassette subfamily C (CFTR/MRP) protein 3
LWSKATFSWLAPLLQLGVLRQLSAADVPPLRRGDAAADVRSAFDAAWSAAAPGKHRLARALLACERKTLLGGFYAKLVHDTVMFASPAALAALLTHVQSSGSAPPPHWAAAVPESRRPAFYVALLFSTAVVQTVSIAQYFHHGYLTGMHARTSLLSACHSKALRLSPAARSHFSAGEVMTFVSADAKRVQDAAPYLQMCWSGPYQIVLSVTMLWSLLGASFLWGVAVIAVLLPMTGALAGVLVRLQAALMRAKDVRVGRVSEALTAIKLLKSAAWEAGFRRRIDAARAAELRQLRLAVSFDMFFGVLWECIPLLVAATAFLVYTAAGGRLTTARVFASLALFDVLRFPLLVLPECITQAASSAVSLRRIQAFLEADEVSPRAADTDDCGSSGGGAGCGVLAKGLSLQWSADAPPAVRNVSLRCAAGELICIVGAVGCGKTTLLSGLLGELQPLPGGFVHLRGSVAYVSQTPFIISSTLRANILFGTPFDALRYARCVAAAALVADLATLPAGDATEIGENGVNLSGGQRQRVALARAAYAQADVYLLDDPLSAVDAAVGRHIFDEMLGPAGLLRGAARVLITHGRQYLPQAHAVLVMQSGALVEQGTWDQLRELGEEAALHGLMQLETADGETGPGPASTAPSAAAADSAKVAAHTAAAAADAAASGDGGLTETEHREEGRVGVSVYSFYLSRAGWALSAGVLFGFAAWTALLGGSKLWLARWATAGGLYSARWAGGYGGICAAALVVLILRQATRMHSQVRAAQRIHASLLSGILRARLSFFVRTPTGRVLNRFSGDCGICDERLHDDACDLLRQACAVGATVVVVAAATPRLLLLMPFLAAAFARVQRRYGASARELQRLESVARSPIFGGVSEALAGATTIRAYGQTGRFELAHADNVDINLRSFFALQSTNRWLTVRTEGLAAVLVLLSASAACASSGTVDPGLAGLSISYAMSACAALSWLVRALAQVENEIVSVERIREYAQLPSEPPLVLAHSRPPPGWPATGAVTFEAVSMRYRPGLPLVLRDVSLHIRGGEKVGVCGRTGAGKSSLLIALLRLADEGCFDGRILIDGLDTSSIGCGDLRGAFAVISQEAVLFSGSLRFNLDPLEASSDDALTDALALVGLAARPLDEEVAEGGANWSAGQRQLLCLARAALRHARLVLADEATSSCDAETDAMMQRTMRSCFAHATVLTVAHRLGTIGDSDRIMVMDGGSAKEFDTPAVLATLPGGIYAALLAESSSSGSRERGGGGIVSTE